MHPQFLTATELSERAHRGQLRKGTDIAYFSHPLAVASDILGRGGSYEQAMAGLCHDILEDCGPEYEAEIAALGPLTHQIVRDCSDCIKGVGPKKGWYFRKLEYLAEFSTKLPESYLVVCCDKLHNSTATVRESRTLGFAALEKFRAPPAMVCWYFTALCCILRRGSENGYLPAAAVDDLEDATNHMIALLVDDPQWDMRHETITKEIHSLNKMLDNCDPFTCVLPGDYFRD